VLVASRKPALDIEARFHFSALTYRASHSRRTHHVYDRQLSNVLVHRLT